jgi:glycosyltransferase involved in cell wall biosynthesis
MMSHSAATATYNERDTASPLGGGPRILILAEDLGGGTGNHICHMLEQWITSGWAVTVVTGSVPLVQRMPSGVDLRVQQRSGWFDHFPLAQIRRVLWLRRIARDVRPDIVHSYFFWPIIYGRLLKLLKAIPALVENREDMGFSWGRGEYALLRWTRAVPDRVICVAEAVRRVVMERERVPPDRAVVIRNGLPSASCLAVDRNAVRRRFGFEDDHVVVGMVANLPRAVKGGHRLLDAVAAITAAAPEVRFLLLGLGTEPHVLAGELAARGIERYVVGVGYRRDVDACYAAMDISVLTSSTEGLSITLLESMRHGLPVVATRVGGNPEAVVDGVTGFLVPLHEPAAFVDRVLTLARAAGLRREMGSAARRRVTDSFAIERVARAYANVYRTLIGPGAPAVGPALGTDVQNAMEHSA